MEAKARRQSTPVSQFPGNLPPLEPPPACESAVPSWDQIVASFLSEHDPSEIVRVLYMTLPKICFVGTTQDFGICHAVLNSVVSPQCYNSLASIGILLIVNMGALVCISSCQEDFIIYRPSQIKNKDLSSSNTVAGEGLIR